MQIVKRALCLVMAASCAFFTGCNSIVYNGNFEFKSFPPETVPAVKEEVESAAQTAEDQDTEKYEIEGEDAFYILPDHENRPDHIIDFKVLGCTADGSFVYAYLTPYYGSSTDGLGSNAPEGTAPADNHWPDCSEKTGTNTRNALVLMSYHPDTRKYKVFYSSTSEKSSEEETTSTEGADEGETLTASAENSSVMANRLVKPGKVTGGNEYFIFDNQTAYVYDGRGKEIFHNDYTSIIEEETGRLKEEAEDQVRSRFGSTEKAQKMISGITSSVSDVVMDGEYYVYIPITVELGETGTETGDGQDLSEDEEELEETTFTTVVACYEIPVGGEDSTVGFYSENSVWEAQKEYWSTLHEEASGLDGNGNFVSKQAMQAYQDTYSMDNIKKGNVGNVPDSFPAFATRNELNLQLCGVSNLFDFQLEEYQITGEWIQNWQDLRLSDLLILKKMAENKISLWTLTMLSIIGLKDGFWDNGILNTASREQYVESAKGVLTLLAQGNSPVSRSWSDSVMTVLAQGNLNRIQFYKEAGKERSGSGKVRFLFPSLSPGAWENGINAMPYTQGSKKDLEALFAYKESVYQQNGTADVVYRYAEVEFPRRYESAEYQPELEMRVAARSEAGEAARTLSYWEYETVTEEDGSTHEVGHLEEEDETLPSYPTAYRLIFPNGKQSEQDTEYTKLKWVESVDTGEMVAFSGGLGAIYYQEEEHKTQDTSGSGTDTTYTSIIRYNNGEKDVLYDDTTSGRPMDAGTLYYSGADGETELVVLITDEGMSFYKKDGQTGIFSSRVFMPLSNLEQAAQSYGTVKYNEETETEEEATKDLQVTEEQKETIRKNQEEGVASDTYSVSNLILFDAKNLLASSLSGGLILVNTESGLTFGLKSGAYYAVFSYQDQGTEKFRVAGYDTESYSYEPVDVARAKCYDMDVRGLSDGKQSDALNNHLDGLANDYLTRTHRLRLSESAEGGTYEIVEATAEEEKANARAEKLFYGSSEVRKEEFALVAGELGVSSIPAAAQEHLESLSAKLVAQRAALAEFYRLAGLEDPEIPAKEAGLLEYEGELISAMNKKTLEDILVELKLSEAAIGRMTGEKKETYQGYRKKMQEVQLENAGDSGGVFAEGSSQGEGTKYEDLKARYEEQDGTAASQQQYRAAMENTDFYQAVLADVSSEYLAQAGKGASWDSYIQDLLSRVSPDNYKDSASEGLKELYQLTGLKDKSLADTEEDGVVFALAEELEGFRRVRELEELIVKYKLSTAEYQGKEELSRDFAAYQEALYGSEAERTAAFQKGSFYQIITGLINSSENASELSGSTQEEKAESWKEKMEDILGKCSGGLILEDQS